ncbi:2537_t:CDS:2, partial [Paraglomus brasilianum]
MSNSTFPTFNVSSSETDMDDSRDLETNQCNGAGIRRARPLQHVFPSLQ